MASRSILIVGEDRETVLLVSRALAAPDRAIRVLAGVDETVAQARSGTVDLVVTIGAAAAGRLGIEVVRAVSAAAPAVRVIVISDAATLDGAVEALRAGAFDYIGMPIDIDALAAAAHRALGEGQGAVGPSGAATTSGGGTMLGRSSVMLQLYRQVAQAASATAPVLILGESGTGKELVARALHAHGPRAARPFLSLNCAAMPDVVLESELFGHVRGAFPAAVSDRTGLFEAATGGTLFLDNVGELSEHLQGKLLRVLQERELRPLGARDAVPVDTRVVAAATSDIEANVTGRRFRQDLYFRLAVFLIRVPSLRDRRQDIPLLVEHFAHGASTRVGRAVTISSGAIARLRQLDWPGNVRELENVIERLVASARTPVVDAADIVVGANPSVPTGAHPFADMPTLDELERRYLVYALQRFAGNRTRTAAALGIDRRTLYRMSARLGVPITGAEIHSAQAD